LWWDGEQALRQIIADIEAGTFRPAKYYHGGVADGVYVPYINPNLSNLIPADVLKKMQSRQEEIISGQFEVPFIVD
jgi:basic membrane lipoprotein Med (substrate-binding protein (PBP1-ABC) superfamily)